MSTEPVDGVLRPAEPSQASEPPNEPEIAPRPPTSRLAASYEIPAARRRNLMRLYGLTEDDFAALLDHCDGRCPMCHKPFQRGYEGRYMRWPCIEHDHRTFEVYGVACGRCNGDLLGVFGRDPAFYERVAAFLRTPPAREALGRRHYVPGAPPREETT